MNTESRKRLEDFVELAELIQSYSYLNDSENIVGGEIKKVDDKLVVDFYQPEKEPTDALLFNLRQFYGAKDDISIRRMAELCNDLEISDIWKKEFELSRYELNIRFDMMVVEGAKGTLTNRDVFEMFLYGSLGHRTENDRAYKMYHKWVTSEEEKALLYNTFHETIVYLLTAVINISKASKEELQRATLSFGSGTKAG